MDIQKRYDNFEVIKGEVVNLLNTLKTCFDSCNSLVKSNLIQDKQYEHITPEERQAVINEIESIRNWVQAAETQQKSKPLWENSVLTPADLKQKSKEITDKTKKLLSKPVPKKEEPKLAEPANTSTKMD